MVRWLNHLPCQLENWSLDFQTPHKCRVGVETQLQCLEGETGNPPSMLLASLATPESSGFEWALCQWIKWRPVSALHLHTRAHKHWNTHINTHAYVHAQRKRKKLSFLSSLLSQELCFPNHWANFICKWLREISYYFFLKHFKSFEISRQIFTLLFLFIRRIFPEFPPAWMVSCARGE